MENLQFGMKVWNSIEFSLLTKHEIIIAECCKIIKKLSSECETVIETDEAWTGINEFLGMKCSAGVVESAVKMTLTKTLLDVVKGLKCRRFVVYKALITVLRNTTMQSFFKSNSKHFAMLAGATVEYVGKLIESSGTDSEFDRNDPLVLEVLEITKNYIKQTPFLGEFRKPFVKYLLVPLTELFIGLRKDDTIDESDFFNILHQIYFADNETSQNPFSQLLLEPENEQFQFLLNIPVHAFMLIVESAFRPLKVDATTQGLFIKFLFNVYFNQSTGKFSNEQQMLLVLSIFLSLLKHYDVPLNFEIDGMKATEYMGKRIDTLNITESNLYEMLLVMCTSIELDPMMLEHSLISIAVKCMVYRKDDRTALVFEKFLILIIDMYRRLSRSEKFISNMMRSMWQKLTEFKLTKKLKRKIGNGSVEESPKRLKLNSVPNGSDVTIESKGNQTFLHRFGEHFNPVKAKQTDSNRTEHSMQWENIQFAWPNRVGEAFSKFISGLVSKPSLVVWKTLIFTMTDYVKLIKDGDLTENSLFLIDWTSALLCQYFHGCRLAEQSDKTWEMIDANRKLQHNLLKEFGNAILSQEHNIRTMNAFVSLCLAAGNFDLLMWFYCPDSITGEQIERYTADGSCDFVHAYLQPTDWGLIEQRISNFGKHECRSNLNRLYMQKIKSKLLFHQSTGTVDLINHLLPSVLGDHDHRNELRDILLDETNNQWFIEQLTHTQKIQVARYVVELDCDETSERNLTGLIVRNVVDQEFFDCLAVALFERIGLESCDDTFVFRRVNFDEVFAGHQSVCKELFRAMKSSTSIDDGSKLVSTSPKVFQLLDVIPLGFVSTDVKNILLHLTLGLLQYDSMDYVHNSCKYLKSKC